MKKLSALTSIMTFFTVTVLGLALFSSPVHAQENPACDGLLVATDPTNPSEVVCAETNPGQAVSQICENGVPVVGSAQCNVSGSESGLLQLFENIIDGLTRLAAAIAIIVIVISGIRFATSSGDPQNAAGARNAILFAMIALVVAVSVEIIINFVLARTVT